MYVKAIWGHKWVAKYNCIYSGYKFSMNFKMPSITKMYFLYIE